MDRCFTALTADRARIGDLTLSWDGPIEHVVVYSGEPGWVCVEPVTMANNGFAMAADGAPRTGVQQLAPGALTDRHLHPRLVNQVLERLVRGRR